jgi:hypothetical protein
MVYETPYKPRTLRAPSHGMRLEIKREERRSRSGSEGAHAGRGATKKNESESPAKGFQGAAFVQDR